MAIGEFAQSKVSQCRLDLFSVVHGHMRQGAQARKTAHRDDVADVPRERPIDVLDLRDVADRPGRQLRGWDAEDANAAGDRREKTGDRLEQRRLPGPVWPD